LLLLLLLPKDLLLELTLGSRGVLLDVVLSTKHRHASHIGTLWVE